jgi:hypothetical protein
VHWMKGALIMPSVSETRVRANGAANEWISARSSSEQSILSFHLFQCPICGATKGRAFVDEPLKTREQWIVGQMELQRGKGIHVTPRSLLKSPRPENESWQTSWTVLGQRLASQRHSSRAAGSLAEPPLSVQFSPCSWYCRNQWRTG